MTRSEVQVPHRPPLRGVFCLFFDILAYSMPIYFIRHGESQANKDGIIAGQTESPLTPMGISQAREAGEKLKLSGLKIDMIVSSPLSRAYNTAVETARAIEYPLDKIVLDPLLKERHLGSLEGSVANNNIQRMSAMSEEELMREGIETIPAITQRALEVLRQFEDVEDNILLVAHNGLGRGLLSAKHNIAFYDIQKLPNAQVIDLARIPPLEEK